MSHVLTALVGIGGMVIVGRHLVVGGKWKVGE